MAKKKPNFLRRWFYKLYLSFGSDYSIDLPLETTEQEVRAMIDRRHPHDWRSSSLRRGKKVKGLVSLKNMATLTKIRQEAKLRQERQAQEGSINYDELVMLPAKMQPEGASKALKGAGVEFPDKDLQPDDPRVHFVWAKLPGGWEKVLTGKPQMFMLMDDRGRERAQIFYGTANQNARLVLRPRYGLLELGPASEWLYSKEPISRLVVDGCMVLGNGEPLYCTETHQASGEEDRLYAYRVATDIARAWLDENRPNWENPLAHWDD